MTDRLVTALGALGALALVYALFFQGQALPPVTRPLSIEAGESGYLGLRAWLEAEGVRVVSLRRRLDSLADQEPPLPEGGNVMITTLPHRTPLRASEQTAAAEWVRRGNTLLVLAALDETPHWSQPPHAAAQSFLEDLSRLTGLTFVERGAEGAPPRSGIRMFGGAPVAADSMLLYAPAVEHELLVGVESLVGYSDLPSALWDARSASPNLPVLRLVNERTTGAAAMWQVGSAAAGPDDGAPVRSARRYVGATIIVSASTSFLTNRNIGTGDTRRFVANLLKHHLGPGGALVFDDMHQGLSSLYDADAFFADPRLHATLLFLVAAWLAYVLGSTNRLVAPRLVVPEPRQRDFLTAAGGFMARRLDRRAAGLLLMNEWFDEVRRRRGITNSAPPWAALEATPALGAELYRALRHEYERLENGRPVGLLRLHNLLLRAREAIG
jgi:hypothetical protein